MQTIIENMLEKFKREIEKFFSQSETSIEQAEDYFVPRVSQVVTELMSAYCDVPADLLPEKRRDILPPRG